MLLILFDLKIGKRIGKSTQTKPNQNTKNTTKQSISRAKSNRLSDNKISPTTSGALQDTSIPTTSTGHPEDIIRIQTINMAKNTRRNRNINYGKNQNMATI